MTKRKKAPFSLDTATATEIFNCFKKNGLTGAQLDKLAVNEKVGKRRPAVLAAIEEYYKYLQARREED